MYFSKDLITFALNYFTLPTMKRHIFVFVWFLSIGIYAEKTTVSLIVHHGSEEKVFVYAPICNRILFSTDTIESFKNDSVYHFSTSIDRPSNMNLRIGKRFIRLLLQPGQQITLNYNYREKQPLKFTCKNAAGLLLFNEWDKKKHAYLYRDIRTFNKTPLDTIPQIMEANFRRMEKEDIASFDSLYKRKEIDREFHDFVIENIRSYYLATFSWIARNGAKFVNKEAYTQYWTKLYKKNPIDKINPTTIYYSEYADFYIKDYQQVLKEKEGKNVQQPKDANEYEYISRIYNESKTDKSLWEFIWGNQLYSLAINNQTNSSAIIPLFKQYKKDFPQSPYLPIFDSFMNKILTYQEITSQNFTSEIHFLDKVEELQTLQDVFNRMKGKPFFVDFWFSQCNPCKKEFQYSPELKKFLDENCIAILYISIDKDDMDENWKNHIKIHHLEGYHVRVPHAVHIDMDKNYGIYAYPTHMLIDKNGKIRLNRTKNPSEKEALYQQIKEALK